MVLRHMFGGVVICSAFGCDRRVHARGLCATHYKRLLRMGQIRADAGIGTLTQRHTETCPICTEVPLLHPYDPTEVARRIGRNPEAMHKHIRRWLPEFADWSRRASNAARAARAS